MLDVTAVHRDSKDARVIADNIRRLRAAAGMSQAQLAEAMCERGQTHWRQTTVSRIENGRQSMTMGEHRDLEEVLGPDVISGTELQLSLRQFSSVVADSVISMRVRRLEELLTEAGETLEDLQQLLKIKRRSGGPDSGRSEG